MDFAEVFKLAITVSNVVATALRLINDPSRQGGYFGLTLPGQQDICVPIYGMPHGKGPRSYALAREKITRLESHPSHRTSHRTRNENAIVDGMPWGQWGGGIRADNGNLLSFSGLPELWDEAVVIVIAVKLGWLDKTAILRGISRERNPHLRLLLAARGI